MPIIITTASGFAEAIRQRLAADTRLIELAALEACQGGLRDVVQATNKERLVDQGLYKLSWSASAVPRGAEIRNSAPYASILEYGRRPNRPGPPLQPILEWVRRKFRGQVHGEYRAARALALGLAQGTAGSPSFRRAAVRYTRESFGKQADAVEQRYVALARVIREHIHFRGTKPHRTLGQCMPKLRVRFGIAARRELRRQR